MWSVSLAEEMGVPRGLNWIDWCLTPLSTSLVISWRSVSLVEETGTWREPPTFGNQLTYFQTCKHVNMYAVVGGL